MRKLSFKYTFTDSLEIPDGATESEIDNLISRKIGRMASQIRGRPSASRTSLQSTMTGRDYRRTENGSNA